MKKNQPIPERIQVNYKGDVFILQPGHSVFELNIKTGLIRQHGLRKRFSLQFWKKPVYEIREHPDLLHVPAFNIYKAAVMLKSMSKTLGITVSNAKLTPLP